MNNRISLRRNVKYSCMQGLYWMLSCTSIVFASVFLLARNYTNSEIGIIMAVGYIAGMILQPIVSGYADRSKILSSTAILALTCLAVAAAVSGLVIFGQKGWPLTVCYVCFLAFQLVLQPMVNAYCFYLETAELSISFGIARGCGSLCWGAMSALLGFLVDKIGILAIPYCAYAVILLFWILLYTCHLEGPLSRAAVQTEQSEGSKFTVRSFFTTYRVFLFILIGNLFLFFGHSQIDNYPYQIITNVGGDSRQLGIFCAYAAFLEMPALFLFDKILKRHKLDQILVFAAIMFFVKGFLLYLVNSLFGVYFANAFQAISFALFVPASVRFAGKIADPCDTNKAQSFVTATATAGNILSSVFGGMMIDGISVKGMLLFGAGASLIGLFFVLIAIKPRFTRKKRVL